MCAQEMVDVMTDSAKQQGDNTVAASGRFFAAGSVSGAMKLALEQYLREREAVRSAEFALLDLDAQVQLKDLEKTARVLMNGAGVLASVDSVPLDEALAALVEGNDPDHEHVPMVVPLTEAVQHQLGQEVVAMAERAEARIWRLLLMAQTMKPAWRVAEFLRRVSRCYVYGFDPECIVMCRSALDAEFESAIPNELCVRHLGDPRRSRRNGDIVFDLCDRTAVARKLGHICEESADWAAKIRIAANSIVHKKPAVNVDAFDAIEQTMNILRELSESLPDRRQGPRDRRKKDRGGKPRRTADTAS